MKPRAEFDVVINGGGIVGLAVAYKIAVANRHVRITVSGMGSVVVHDVPAGKIGAGDPARERA